MVRVAVVSGPDPGHLLPCTAVALALAHRGHHVAVFTGRSWREDLETSGLAFRWLRRLAEGPEDSDFGWRMWGRAAHMTPPLAESFDDLRPDVVLVDTLTAAGGFAAELAGAPWVEMVPHWLWAPSEALPPIGLGQRPARTPIGRFVEEQQRRQQRASIEEGERLRRRARREVGLPPVGGPALTLLGTLPDLEPARPDWPERTFIAGPLEWEPPSWPDPHPPAGDGPLVLVTDSTASNVEVGIAGDAVTALEGEGVRVVATTTADLPSRPWLTTGRARHGPVLDRASCAVGYAGHGLVAKALSRGVPLVLVPLQGDQRETASRVERAGAGRLVWPEEASPAALREAVRAVLDDPSYTDAARRMGRHAAGLGPERAATLIERRAVDRHRTPGSCRSAPAS